MSVEIPRPSVEEVWEWLGGTVVGRKGTCVLPDHEDRNPSCSIREDEGKWRCFACNQGGDVVDLVMLAKGVNFLEGIELLKQFKDIGVADDYQPSSSLAPARPSKGGKAWTPPWRAF